MKPVPVILVSPLDWGLGHATRCIPVIKLLLKQGAKVIIASEGPSATLLQEAFPQLTIIPIKGYNIRYHRTIPAGIKLIFSAWRILLAVVREHRWLKKTIREHKIDAVISDNRYGLWNPKVHTVFITHQLNLISPLFPRLINPLLAGLVRFFVKKFDACWIPDYAGEYNLSGKLSHGRPLPGNARFIGPLSRFTGMTVDAVPALSYDLVAIVSGPEPQRSIFRKLLLDQLRLPGVRSLIVGGVPGNIKIIQHSDGLHEAGHLPAEALFSLLSTKPVVVCRAGYSTMMDIAVTSNPAILIPTPGQTEQEYLAVKFAEKSGYVHHPQKKCLISVAYAELLQQAPPMQDWSGSGGENDGYIKDLMGKLLSEKIEK